jgi:integrase
MPPRKCWSKTFGAGRGVRVRVYERTLGGPIQIAVWLTGCGWSRRSLGHTDRAKAVEQAKAIVRLREDKAPEPATHPSPATLSERSPATVGELLEGYLAHATHTRQGCLITDRHSDDRRLRAILLLRWYGHDAVVDGLTNARIREYVRARRAGEVTGRVVRVRSAEADLSFLKAAVSWACGAVDPSLPLVSRNVFAEFPIEEEPNPRRPFIDDADVDALFVVAASIHPLFPLLMVLAGSTGRRLSSVLGLTWADVQFARGRIRWRGELDKKRETWLGPLPRVATDALHTHRARLGNAPGRLIFPSTRDPNRPVTRHLAADWLKRAYRITGIEKEPGSLWHAFRRKWGHDRQDYPTLETMYAGGWKDFETFRRCYQYPDSATMQAVADLAPIPEKRTQKRTHLIHNANSVALVTESDAAA